jgi:hypothetical protein
LNCALIYLYYCILRTLFEFSLSLSLSLCVFFLISFLLSVFFVLWCIILISIWLSRKFLREEIVNLLVKLFHIKT